MRLISGNANAKTRLYAGTSEYPALRVVYRYILVNMRKNVTGADNQQGSPLELLSKFDDPSETTRRAPFRTKGILEAYLQGALHDASLNKRKRYRFTQKGTEWLEVIKIILKSLGYNSWIYREGKDREVYALETTASFLNFQFNVSSLNSLAEQLAYIRGFFDAEGGIPRKKDNRFYIQLVQKDKPKLMKMKNILKKTGINTGVIHNPSKKVDPEYWRMFVSANSHVLFFHKVGTWHPRKYKIFKERMKI